jgi:FKBP-type peptidyl-prolyl cis-trans isomerase (trigger factor)
MDELIANAEVKMPKMLIDSELSRMVHEMSANIQQMGLTIESYLKHIGKDIEALKKEWLPDAEKRAKTQLILNQVALEEKITASEEEIAKEVADGEPEQKEYTVMLGSDYDKEKLDPTFGDKYNMTFLKDLETRKYEFAAKKAPKVKTTNDLPGGKSSPIGSKK